MRMAGVAHTKTSKEMENHVFMKAKTRDEYLSLVARLIIHFRDIRNKCTCLFFSPDPMNALQNLTGGPPAGPGAMGMASRPQGASLAGMSGLGPPMGQPMNLPGQQPPGTAGMAPHGIPNIPATTQLQLQQMAAQQQQQQQQFQQQQQQAALQQQQQQFQAQQSAMQQQQFQVQQQQQAAAVAQQQMQVVQQQQQMLKLQLHQQSQQQVRAKASTSPSLSCPAAADRKALARPAPVVILGRGWAGSPEALSLTGSSVLHSWGPRERGPHFMPLLESDSEGEPPAPESSRPEAKQVGEGSSATPALPFNMLLFVPQGNPSSVMSPASSSQSEEQQYLEKLKQLSKYIEPLRRMINKIDKNEDRKKDLSKMKSLLDILTDPKKRCPLKTLQKCEIALEKLKNDMAVPTPPPPAVPPTKQQYLCQPLLDAVLANIRSPVFNHSLYRTFMPAVTAIHGPPIMTPVPSPRKRKYEDDERQTIPNVLQGEVARLNPKFLVNLDPAHCSNNGTVHLICKIDDKNLPSVPPLQLSVPADYPEQSPLWIDNPQQYEANPFLQSVYRYMMSKLLQLPDKHSVTALLNTWAQSIRQACLSAA
uniref:Mediator of RNA polymerase II transcription subunit 15 n=1 Tax=Naja naja TaxID=35670 RepID=A0A8C6YBW1_NAJNA